MIDATILPMFTGLFPIVCAITLLVLRAGASRVFFDIVGTFQAGRLIQDAKAQQTVFEALYLDTFSGIQEAAEEIGDQFTQLLDHVIPITEEIEEARIQLEKFLDMNEKEMAQAAEMITDIGLAYAFTADEAMLAGAKMAQLSGVLGPSSLGEGTEIGMMFGLISDMETDAAMQRMVNLQQQTKFMTKNIEEGMSAEEEANVIRRDSIRVLDQLNTVENRSVATMEQITFVMNQFASQAELTNESIASMAALSATLIEAGEEQGKGGRALRMMYARLGADINGSRKAVEDLGIAVADSEGNMRPFSDVLQDLAVKYREMSGEEQTALAQQVAGNRHYTRLIKLLENVDRVKELEFEATIAMFPAMDEIERRRDTELFQLQEAEAAYKNQVGVLGNELLPTLTAVTERQTVFVQQINALAKSPFGALIKVPIFLAKSMESFAGPAFNMLLSLQNMNIALQTQHAITRALNGEKIAGMDNSKTDIGYTIDEIALEKQLAASVREVAIAEERKKRAKANEGKNLNTTEFKKSVTNIGRLDGELETLSIRLGEIKNELAPVVGITRQYEGATEQLTEAQRLQNNEATITRDNLLKERTQIQKTMRQKIANRRTFHYKVEGYKEIELRTSALMTEIEERKVKIRAKGFNQMSIGLSSVGSAMMMFTKNEKVMRLGIILNGMAMAAQAYKAMSSAVANIFQAKTTEILTEAMKQEAIALGALDLAQKKATVSTKQLQFAQMSLAAKGGVITIVVGAIYLLTEAYSYLTKSTKDATDTAEDFGSTMLDTSRVIEILLDDSININAELAEQDRLLNALDSSNEELTKTKVEGIMEERRALMSAKGIKAFQEDSFDISPAKAYFEEISKQTDSLKDEWLEKKLPWLNSGQIKKRKGFIDKEFKDSNESLLAFINKHGVTSYAQLEIAAEEYGDTVRNLLEDENADLNNLGKTYNAVTDEISNFGNAREEMFYGFDRNKLTGDLIRQVNQQGVETLVTTTEVIMTNNFNGMTVPQVADMIIEEIEGRANLRGYNILQG